MCFWYALPCREPVLHWYDLEQVESCTGYQQTGAHQSQDMYHFHYRRNEAQSSLEHDLDMFIYEKKHYMIFLVFYIDTNKLSPRWIRWTRTYCKWYLADFQCVYWNKSHNRIEKYTTCLTSDYFLANWLKESSCPSMDVDIDKLVCFRLVINLPFFHTEDENEVWPTLDWSIWIICKFWSWW